tara:strand:+ start:1496 stop:2035 length:540 start_codon:yes stop_codon:yes gene_type:complete
MWKDIIKVDRFTNEGNFKGSYDDETKEISVNLDNFVSRSKLNSDTERMDEFIEVVTHENAHKEYDNIIGKEMRKALGKVLEEALNYSNIPFNDLETRKNKIKDIKETLYVYFNYAIVNERFAYATGETDNTIGSMRAVMAQISKKINDIVNWSSRPKDKYISILIREMYEEIINNIKEE